MFRIHPHEVAQGAATSRRRRRGLTARVAPVVIQIGRALPPKAVARIRQGVGLLEIGSWTARECQSVPALVDGRSEVFSIALDRINGAEQPLYVEFGVYAGESLTWWSSHLANRSARFLGFDSFQGLPHDWQAWQGALPKGLFALDRLPDISDDRVSLISGWFEATLPGFEFPTHDVLVVTMDADLYSSTALVLAELASVLKKGDLVYFDDFPMEEHSALADVCSKTGLRLDPIAMERQGFNWLFTVIAEAQR